MKQRVVRSVAELLGYDRFAEEWFIGIRRRNWSTLDRRPARGFRILRAADGWFADPFLLKRDSQNYLFFEHFRQGAHAAVIACARLWPTGEIEEPEVVLARDHHLSYPFVFQSGGETYLLPESSANRTVDLYRATDFPIHWELASNLMREFYMVDGTIFHDGATFWLFGNVLSANGSDWDDLHLFWAEDLLGPWRPHPRNPIVSSRGSSRPAGRLFYDKGRLIRPSQDCRRRYGHRIVLNRVDVLSRDRYREVPIAAIGAGWIPRNRGSHSIDHNEDFEVIDGRFRQWRRRSPGVPRTLDGDRRPLGPGEGPSGPSSPFDLYGLALHQRT